MVSASGQCSKGDFFSLIQKQCIPSEFKYTEDFNTNNVFFEIPDITDYSDLF